MVDPSGHNPIPNPFDYLIAAGCAVGGPALANSIRGMQVLSSLAIGFIPGVGDAYLLLSSIAGQDLITGTKLTQSERELYAGMAAFSLATMIIGAGVFSQEAVAATRTVEELGQLERFGSELAHGAETEVRAAEDVGHAAEGVTRGAGDAGAVGGEVKFQLSLSKVRGPEDMEAAELFVKKSNDLIESGATFVRQAVSKALGTAADSDAQAYGRLMRKAGFSMVDSWGQAFHAGHIPDTTWTGLPRALEFMRLPGWINGSFGRQAEEYDIGWRVTKFSLEWVP